MNLNPFDPKSTWYTGKGAIWGAKEYGKPNIPSSPQPVDFESLPSFDRSPMANAMIQRINEDLGIQQAKAGAQASKMGAGRSSGSQGVQTQLANEAEKGIRDVRFQSALAGWQDRRARQKELEDMNAALYKLAMERAKWEGGMNEAEDKRRRDMWGQWGKFLS